MKLTVRNILIHALLMCVFLLSASGDTTASERPKVGLALSGGGAMGLAHIGVLHTIDSLDIPVDYIAGTSMGGLVGGLYSVGYTAAEIDSLARTIQWSQMFRDLPSQQAMPYYLKQDRNRYQLNIEMQNFQPVTSGLIRGQNIRILLTELTEPFLTVSDFRELPIPFACTAVDLLSGKVVVLDRGSLPTAMRATMSIPSVFTPVQLDSMLLIDGGLLNNLPTDIVREMGADIIIASAVRNPTTDTDDIRSILDVVSQSFHIARNSQIDAKAQSADVFIDIRLPGVLPADFSKKQLQHIMNKGYRVARAGVDSLNKFKQLHALNRSPAESAEPDPVHYTIDSVSTHGHLTPLPPETRGEIHALTGMEYNRSVLDSVLASLCHKGLFDSVRCETIMSGSHSVHLKFFLRLNTQPEIHRISVHGNQQVSSAFIKEALHLHPGTRFNPGQLQNRINYLYSLGFFTNVTYDLSVSGYNAVDIDIYVEEHTFQTLRLGVQYDNYYHLVPFAKFDWDNLLFSGLRWESQLYVMGYTQVAGELSYHPQEIMFSVYPFIRVKYNEIQKSIYNGLGQRLTVFRERNTGITVGAGLQFRENIISQVGFSRQDLRLSPALQLQLPGTTINPETQHTVHSIDVSAKIDFLDSYLTPTRGFLVDASYETSNSMYLGSDVNYGWLQTSFDYYYPFGKRHHMHLNFYLAHGFHTLPVQKYFYSGGPTSFIGLQYDQLVVKSLTYLRTDYSYRISEDIYVKLLGNYILEFQHLAQQSPEDQALYGYGLALQYNTFIGPAILTIANGPASILTDTGRQTVAYFTLGYRF